MLMRSPIGTRSGMASIRFSEGTDSPVSAASSIFRFTASVRRMSAGTESPVSSTTTSPGTSCRDSITCISPSRTTLQCGADSFSSASSDFSALASCITPMIAFRTTIERMIITSEKPSPLRRLTVPDIAAATIRTIIMKLLNWLRNFTNRLLCRVFSNSL